MGDSTVGINEECYSEEYGCSTILQWWMNAINKFRIFDVFRQTGTIFMLKPDETLLCI
jgi:hypothetical protein